MKNVFLVTDTDTIISGRLTQKINACIASEESVQFLGKLKLEILLRAITEKYCPVALTLIHRF